MNSYPFFINLILKIKQQIGIMRKGNIFMQIVV